MLKEFSSVQGFPTKILRVSHTRPVHSVCPILPVSFEHFKKSFSFSFFFLFFSLLQRYRFRLFVCRSVPSLGGYPRFMSIHQKIYTTVLYEVTLRPVPLTPSTVCYSLVFLTIDVIQGVQRERKFMEGKRDCAHCHHVISLLTVCVQ